MSQTPHVAVVEDDPEIMRLVARYLRDNGFRVSTAGDGRALDHLLAESRVDLVVLDVMLPGEDGVGICGRLRRASPLPVILLTAKSEDIDRIVGLEMGADDYMTKPFNPRELLARIRAVLRRTVGERAEPRVRAGTIAFNGWRLDCGRRQLFDPTGARVPLTDAELDLLQAFCERPGRILSRERLIEITQGRAAGLFERSVDVLVSRLRRKIEPDPQAPDVIRTVRSEGYLFAAEAVTS